MEGSTEQFRPEQHHNGYSWWRKCDPSPRPGQGGEEGGVPSNKIHGSLAESEPTGNIFFFLNHVQHGSPLKAFSWGDVSLSGSYNSVKQAGWEWWSRNKKLVLMVIMIGYLSCVANGPRTQSNGNPHMALRGSVPLVSLILKKKQLWLELNN